MNKCIEEYIELCRVIGPCLDLVQTNGGNISIKFENNIIIKESGFAMANTSYKNGYVLCSIDAVWKQFNEKDENCSPCIIEKYSETSTPSIELFFHLLPKKLVLLIIANNCII